MTTRQIGNIVLPNTGGSIIGRQVPTAGAPVKLGPRQLDLKQLQTAIDEKLGPKMIASFRARGATKAADKFQADLDARVAARAQPATTPPAPATSSSTSSSTTRGGSKRSG